MYFLMDVLLGWIEKSQEGLTEKIRLLDVILGFSRFFVCCDHSRQKSVMLFSWK
jgi:hypothetical protein